MIENYLKLPLAWYDSTSKQQYKRTGSVNDYITIQLINPKNIIIPFQIKRKTRPNEITTFYLYTREGVAHTDLTTILPTGNLYIKTLTNSGYDYICYENFSELTSDLTCGQYYIKLSDGVETWYSDLLTVTEETFDFGGDLSIGSGGFEIKPSDIIGWTT